MKKYMLVFSAVLLLMPFLALAQAETAAESNGITLKDLEVSDPGLLPTSNFYFFKEFIRGLQRTVTFNAVRRAELELKIANEKAAEIKRLESAADEAALTKALENYKESAERLKTRFETLKETSENPNIDKLLDKLADRTLKHQQLFEELKAKHEGLKDKIEAAEEDLEEATADAAERLDTVEKLKERFEKAVLNQRERSVKEVRAIGVLDKIEERIKNDEVRVKISEVKDGLIKKFDARVSGRLIAPSAVPGLLENLPITEAQKLRILEQVKERTGSVDVKIRLENIEGRVKEGVKEAARNKKEEAERMMKAAAELINDLKERINSGKYRNIPTSVKTLLERAENHMANAKAAFENGKYGEAFGQANSAASTAKNAVSQLLKVNTAPPIRSTTTQIDPDSCSAPCPQYSPSSPIVEEECKLNGGKLVSKPDKCGCYQPPVCIVQVPATATPKTITTIVVPKTWTVEHTDNRFIPSEIKIKKGDTVMWVNGSGILTWPASAIHPTHQVYPGFDALKSLSKGESYSFTFGKVGSWKYHNHLNPSVTGSVIVEE